jgi:hypothetical protein
MIDNEFALGFAAAAVDEQLLGALQIEAIDYRFTTIATAPSSMLGRPVAGQCQSVATSLSCRLPYLVPALSDR